MKQEPSVEEVAQKIVTLSRCGPIRTDHNVAAFVVDVLRDRIVEALRNEREACAVVAETDDFTHSSGYRCYRGEVIAAAIRRRGEVK